MWLSLMRARAEETNNQVVAEELTAVAKQLGHNTMVSRTVVSLILNGKYPAKTERIELLVLTRYAHVQCPHLGEKITFADCRNYHLREAPTSSPFAMRHWRACQECPNNKSKATA